MDIFNDKNLEKIGKWMDKYNMFYVPAQIGWKILSGIVKFEYKKHEIYMIGQSHLDACWMWTWRETVRKNDKTFSNALKHIEDYPFFTFSCSSPCYYYWMEKYFPEKFKKIKKYISEGKIELIGGMWVEPDIILINGESLVRQRLYGQRYYLEKFGKISKVGWLSDTFGYCWTLPQILKKSGSDYFYTNKMQWNDTNDWPFVLFYWQSPDGSRIMTYTYSYTLNLIYQTPNLGGFTKASRLFKVSNQEFNYTDGFKKVERMKGDKYLREFGFVYGLGDGGGGPVRSEVIFFKELYRKGIVKGFITMEQYFKILEKYKNEIPVWNDEMYLEFHRGCYTSHSWLKSEMRNVEQLLFKTEVLATIANKFGNVYPKIKLENLYKKMLFNQFHDILPGSSIPEVYNDTKQDLKSINQNCNKLNNDTLDIIRNKLSLEGNFIIFNPLNWSRSSIIELKEIGNCKIKDNEGKQIPVQEINDNKIVFITPEIPSIGFLELNIENIGKSNNTSEYQTDLHLQENETELKIENQYILLKINKNNGNISSIFHKKLQKEILTGDGNEIQIFREKFGNVGFTAWNLDRNYQRRPRECLLESINIKEQGPVRIRVEVKKKMNKSTFIQSIILYNDIDRIDFNLKVEFYEKWHLVKLAFPINVNTEYVNCEIPFGVIRRSTKPKNSAEAAKFEIPVQRWLDLSDNEYGVTFINRSRYGFDVKYDPNLKNILRMTILRVPKYPPKGSPIGSIFPSRHFHDQIYFSVDYSLFIHEKNWIESKAYKKGIDFNVPVIFKQFNKNTGKLKLPIELISIVPENIIISAIKLSEDDNDSIIIRVYETTGKDSKCAIKFNELFKLENVEEVDLLELNPKPIQEFTQNEIFLNIKKFEIKTIKVKLLR